MKFRLLLASLLAIVTGLIVEPIAAAPTRNIYIVAGPDGVHAPVGHAFQSSAIIWTNRLIARGQNLNCYLLNGWPSNPNTFSNADAIVLYSDGGCSHETGVIGHEIMRNGRWDRAMQVINRGVSYGAVHYAVEPSGAPQSWQGLGWSTGQYGTNEYVNWLGGYYVGWYVTSQPVSWNDTFTANLIFPAHVVNSNVSYSGFEDEWYSRIYFGRTVDPFLQVNNHPQGGGTHNVGWTHNRDDGSRGLGWTGGHYTPGSWYSGNSSNNLSLLLNAIEWLGRVDEEDRHEVLIRSGTSWKYDADGTQDANWSSNGFSDAGWSSGSSPLGYDDYSQDWIATTVAAGTSGNRPITTWYRKSFNVPTLNNVTNFQVKLNADDGAVVYLNGTEIGRLNMPSGSISSSTTASNSVEVNWTTVFDTVRPYADQAAWDSASQAQRDEWTARFNARNIAMTNYYQTPEFNWYRFLGGNALVQGSNVLAIEVHQRDSSNPDMRLDVEASLLGNSSFIPGDTSTVTGAPSVSISAASAITETSATLNGTLTSTGALPTWVRIVWGPSDAGTNGSWPNFSDLGFRTVGAISTNVGGLLPITTYYYRLVATNIYGATWSSAQSFTTKPSTFTAYNDVSWDSSQPSNKITSYSIVSAGGPLVDYASGVTLDAMVSFTASNGAAWAVNTNGHAPVGTAAYSLFPSNIISSDYHSYFDSASITLSGLVPTNLYTVILYANRDGDAISGDYTSRYTVVTLSGATSFQNNSTTNLISQSSASNTIRSGVSHGAVFRFDQINPGGDGTVVFSLSGFKPCLNSFLVQTPSTNVAAGESPTFIASGATWMHYSTGMLPATNWTARTFSDGGWSSGPAPLGYGDGAVLTTLDYGGVDTNRWITYYFRKHFTITNLASVTGLLAQSIADDGAVFYLNGTKVRTSTNLPIIGIDNGTLTANFEPEPYVWTPFTISPSGLVTGDNVLAVEVHQSGYNSSDLYFDMSLDKVGYVTTNQPGGYSTNAPPALSNWIAYNDIAWSSGQLGANITKLSFVDDADHDMSGALLRFSDGQTSGVSATFAGLPGAQLWVTTNQGAPSAGTPADLLFAGKIDMNRTVYFPGTETGSITLTGMSASQLYRIVLFGNRANPTYTDRTTVVTLGGADSFTNSSSQGASVSGGQGEVTSIVSGTNNGGLVFSYSSVAPGGDGQVVLTVRGSAGGQTAYLNAMLVELQSGSGGGADADADSLPDSWEQTYFGGTSATNGGAYQDADGDGVLNIEEFIVGSNPTSGSSGPMMDHIARTNSMVQFDLMTVTGRVYDIDYRTNLTAASWQLYTSFLGNGSTMAVSNTTLDPRFFYRFRVRMQNP